MKTLLWVAGFEPTTPRVRLSDGVSEAPPSSVQRLLEPFKRLTRTLAHAITCSQTFLESAEGFAQRRGRSNGGTARFGTEESSARQVIIVKQEGWASNWTRGRVVDTSAEPSVTTAWIFARISSSRRLGHTAFLILIGSCNPDEGLSGDLVELDTF